MGKLVEESWLPYAKKLEEGQRAYHNHTCGGGKTLVVSCDSHGWSGYCFRCHDKGFVPFGIRPLGDLSVIRKKEILYENKTACELPKDFTQEVPVEYAVWFARNGITEKTWKRYGCGYSDELKRIILPVYDTNGRLIFTQARAVESWRKPKYLNQGEVRKSSVLFRSSGLVLQPHGDDVQCVCITEDIASSIRVGHFIPSISTLGTSLSTEQAAQIAMVKAAFIWYDADAAGRAGDVQAQRVLRMLGMNCYSICTPKDPKLYSNREIQAILEPYLRKAKER